VRLIDSHSHLQADAFASDRARVIAASRAAGVERLLVPGWDAISSEAAVGLAAEHGWIDAAAGIHPHEAAAASDADWATVVRLAADPRVVAIGETGLDFDRMHSPADAQIANLRRHLRLALEPGKPAILHCRSAAGGHDAQDALLGELWTAGLEGAAAQAAFGERPPAVLHSFSGSMDYASAAAPPNPAARSSARSASCASWPPAAERQCRIAGLPVSTARRRWRRRLAICASGGECIRS